jgi:hypothetical protein
MEPYHFGQSDNSVFRCGVVRNPKWTGGTANAKHGGDINNNSTAFASATRPILGLETPSREERSQYLLLCEHLPDQSSLTEPNSSLIDINYFLPLCQGHLVG